MNTNKVVVLLNPDRVDSFAKWQVVDRASPENRVERQVFPSRKEARLYAQARNQSASFMEGVNAYVAGGVA
jgi:hypothetical protein